MIIRSTAALLASCLAVAGCASTGAGSATANGPTPAPSGITAANGGGQRALGDIPNIGVSNGVTVRGNAPNTKGNSY